MTYLRGERGAGYLKKTVIGEGRNIPTNLHMEHLKGLFEWSGSKHFQPSNCSDGKGTEATHGYLTIPLIYTRVLSSYCEKFEERSGDGGETTN